MAGGMPAPAAAPTTTSLQRLYTVEKRIVHAVEVAGSVLEELANPGGPRAEAVSSHCRDFLDSVKDVRSTLREEIKSSCDYRVYENCDYAARSAAEIKVQKLQCVLGQLQCMQEVIDEYHSRTSPS